MFMINSFWFGQQGGGPGTDPDFANTKLLLGFEGADGSIAPPDESPSAHGTPIGAFGHAQIDTSQFKFGASSALFDGAGDFFTWDSSGEWDFGATDEFTVEAWVRFNGLTGFQTVVSKYTDSFTNRSWLLDFTGSALRFHYSTTGGVGSQFSVQGSWTPTTGTWYHVAADCDASRKLRVYAHGEMVASATSVPAFAVTGSDLRVGAIGSGANYFNGWIDELRLTKGTARYASDSGYSVPTAAFPRS